MRTGPALLTIRCRPPATWGSNVAERASALSLEQDVVEICQNLLRIDTSNYGDNSGPGERKAAEYCAELLSEAGLACELFEAAPGRTSLVTRLAGADPSRPALVVHGHTDVVPAQAADWTHPPFAGELIDGVLWGRGAVDMKDMDAMILAVVRNLVRTGRKPARDLIIAMFADEEAGGVQGAQWAVQHRPELFAGATEAISEVGGYSVQIAGQRAYLVQTAEKGLAWLKLIASGTAGHGSAINHDNAVTKLAQAVTAIANYQWPIRLIPTTKALLTGVAELTGLPFHPAADADEAGDQLRDEVSALANAIGSGARFILPTVQTTANPSGLTAGYKVNVIPGEAQATIDMRPLPGDAETAKGVLKNLVGPDISIEPIHEDISVESPLDSPLVAAMAEAIHSQDPGAPVLPYCLGGGTDNKSLSRLGITGYGFAPLQLPPDLDFTGMFHGVDERVPVSALHFGARVLDEFLTIC